MADYDDELEDEDGEEETSSHRGGGKKKKKGEYDPYDFRPHSHWREEIWNDFKNGLKKVLKAGFAIIAPTVLLSVISFNFFFLLLGFILAVLYIFLIPVISVFKTPIDDWWYNVPGHQLRRKKEMKKRWRVYRHKIKAGDSIAAEPEEPPMVPIHQRPFCWVPYVYGIPAFLVLFTVLSFATAIMGTVRSVTSSTPEERRTSAEETARKIGEALGHSPTTPKPNLSRPATPAPEPAVIELTEEFKSVPLAYGVRANVERMGTAVVVRYPDGRLFHLYAYGTKPSCVAGDPDAMCSFELRGGKEVPIGGLPDIPNGARRAIEIKTIGGPGKVRIEYLK